MDDAPGTRTAVNARGRYAKRDGSVVGAGQIHLRTRAGGSYEHLFERDGQRARLRASQPVPVTVASDGRKPPADEDLRYVMEGAVAALTAPRHALADTEAVVPHVPRPVRHLRRLDGVGGAGLG